MRPNQWSRQSASGAVGNVTAASRPVLEFPSLSVREDDRTDDTKGVSGCVAAIRYAIVLELVAGLAIWGVWRLLH